uniref:Uncharacterized protein n=1 Tax=Erwinia amylovora ATCC BAA-2158 TaxID=889211 RepID=E5B4W4_ERWAM|nr:hypothetical protein predicted by Glimmer/Critica [Erwinia amylovora ATCC BAA-2158]
MASKAGYITSLARINQSVVKNRLYDVHCKSFFSITRTAYSTYSHKNAPSVLLW